MLTRAGVLIVVLLLLEAGGALSAGTRQLAPPVGVAATPVAGKTKPRVRLPGTNHFVSLDHAQKLPQGTTVDVSGNAAIRLSDRQGQAMVFSGLQPGSTSSPDGVSSQFVYRGVKGGYIQLVLVGGNFSKSRTFSSVGTPTASPKKPKVKKPARRLWGSGKGHFTTIGKYASASVRGTTWEMADYTNGTLCVDKHGLVSVRDLVRKKTVLLRAGTTYFARSR